MRRLLATFFLALCLPIIGACSQTTTRRQGGPFLVPSAAIIQRGASRSYAADILPSADEDYFFPRGERSVYGSYSLGDVSAYTLFTYDAQRISNGLGDVGYQYRWVVQQGTAYPPAP